MRTTQLSFLILMILFEFPVQNYAQGNDGSWVKLSSTGFTPRTGLISAAINGKIYVIGGLGVNNVFLDTVEVFDPSSNSWSTPVIAGNATSRYLMASVVYNGRIYIFGGTHGLDQTNVDEFDPASNMWITPQTTGTFTARDALTASVVGNKIYVIGGENNVGPVNTLEVFDPATNKWSTPATTGTFVPTSFLTSAVVNDSIYVLGGYDGSMDVNNLFVFDPVTNVWSMPVTTGTFTPRDKLTSCVLNGKIYVLGGNSNGQIVNTMEVFDPATNTWSTPVTTGNFTPRAELTSSVVNGQIYAMGGLAVDEVTVLDTNEVFKPVGTGVQTEQNVEILQLSPNPTSGKVTLYGFDNDKKDITVIDVFGNKFIDLKYIQNRNITLDLSNFVAGTYYVMISSHKSFWTRMIVKE